MLQGEQPGPLPPQPRPLAGLVPAPPKQPPPSKQPPPPPGPIPQLKQPMPELHGLRIKPKHPAGAASDALSLGTSRLGGGQCGRCEGAHPPMPTREVPYFVHETHEVNSENDQDWTVSNAGGD